jgi:hypothetical protein
MLVAAQSRNATCVTHFQRPGAIVDVAADKPAAVLEPATIAILVILSKI